MNTYVNALLEDAKERWSGWAATFWSRKAGLLCAIQLWRGVCTARNGRSSPISSSEVPWPMSIDPATIGGAAASWVLAMGYELGWLWPVRSCLWSGTGPRRLKSPGLVHGSLLLSRHFDRSPIGGLGGNREICVCGSL